MSISLPILPLATPGQRYSCHGCGNCCRDFTVQLRPEDSQRIRQQAWENRIGTNPIVVFRGQEYLRQLADGACIFLLDDGRCRIHAEYGLETKPVACQMFPYMLAPSETASQMGVSFACQSVVENKGKQYNEQVSDALKIVLRGIPEVVRPARSAAISRSRRAEAGELEALKSRLVRWIQRDSPLHQRLDGLAWIAQTLSVAQLNKVRGSRFKELVDLLFDALADELPLHPIGSAIPRQIALFQGSVFARTEDPKLKERRADFFRQSVNCAEIVYGVVESRTQLSHRLELVGRRPQHSAMLRRSIVFANHLNLQPAINWFRAGCDHPSKVVAFGDLAITVGMRSMD